jgi:hypothetical protein
LRVIKYQIFEITQDGLVKRPKKEIWSDDRTAYQWQDFDTPEEANEELKKDERTGDYLILPVSTNTY